MLDREKRPKRPQRHTIGQANRNSKVDSKASRAKDVGRMEETGKQIGTHMDGL